MYTRCWTETSEIKFPHIPVDTQKSVFKSEIVIVIVQSHSFMYVCKIIKKLKKIRTVHTEGTPYTDWLQQVTV